MSIRNLDYLFEPKSIALIGASDEPGSVGAVLVHNLLGADFRGPIMPVNPKRTSVGGILAYKDVASLPQAPDLAVIATPAHYVPDIIAQLGARGTRAAVVISAGFSETRGGENLTQNMLDASRPHCLRIIGPNCLGIMVPHMHLNASFAHRAAKPGTLAFISQSGALCTSVLDWAAMRDIGFSHFISLGNRADVDFADLLDHLAMDERTRAILLYIESVATPRKFLSAARAAARNKPVIVIKSGRFAEGAKAALSHTGALAGADEVYEAAFRRAGLLRVYGMEELFDAAETLAFARPVRGERLAIVSNGGGPGVLATDMLMARGGTLAEINETTCKALDAALPAVWSRSNPIDLIGDAKGARYEKALDALLNAQEVDGVLAMYSPTAVSSPEECADAVIRSAGTSRKTLLTAWLGGHGMDGARDRFDKAGVPTYDSPERAVNAFQHMVNYRRNQQMLMETPSSQPANHEPDAATARAVIHKALAEGRTMLNEPEAKAVLKAYHVPTVETVLVHDEDEAIAAAERLVYPVALKIVSPQITHKSDVGGVVLDIAGPAGLRDALAAMRERVAKTRPEAVIEGFSVQQMAVIDGSYELIVGVHTDRQFGPVILFGEGGTAVEIINDKAIGLPPLNSLLAQRLVEQTRIYKLLRGYRHRGPVDFAALQRVMTGISQMVIDLPELVELDINPLLCDERRVLALDARIGIARAAVAHGAERLAIRPYPKELEEKIILENGESILLRPIRPEDAAAFRAMVEGLAPYDRYLRFFNAFKKLAPSTLNRLTQLDYEREMEFVAVREKNGEQEILGSAGSFTMPGGEEAEFAMMVRSDMQRQGLGHRLMDKMIRYCEVRGITRLFCHVLTENERFINIAGDFGFLVEETGPDALRMGRHLARAAVRKTA